MRQPAPHLTLLQTPARPTPASFDASRPAPHTDALRRTWWAGHASGFKGGYVQGWRYGLLCGACTIVCLTTLLAAFAAGLGWL